MNLYEKVFSSYVSGRRIVLHPLYLFFSKDQKYLEKLFQKDYFEKYLNLFRVCHFFAVFFYCFFAIVDYFVFIEQKDILLFVKFGFVVPFFLAGFVFTFHKGYEKLWPVINTFYIVLTGAGFLFMIVNTPPPLGYSYYAGIIVCLIFGYTFIRSFFILASLAGSVLLILFIIISVILKTPMNIMFINSFFLLIVNLLGMLICYSAEISARKDFFIRYLLEQEKQKVSAVNEKLEKIVVERTEKLQKSNRMLKKEIEERDALESRLVQSQKMEAIGNLAGGIAHDFNNVLYPIMGFAELVLDDLNEEFMDENQIRNNVTDILKAAERARDLVSHILTFSRKAERMKIPVSIQSIIDQDFTLLRASIPATIDLRMDLEPEGYTVLADPTQIHQLVMNLCTNAYQAMDEYGGILGIKLNKKIISGSTSDVKLDLVPGIYLELTISDTGKGMEPDLLKNIFEPYFTTKDVGSGTGLGLAVVHGVVKENGGDIYVESELYKGSAFHIYLPVINN